MILHIPINTHQARALQVFLIKMLSLAYGNQDHTEEIAKKAEVKIRNTEGHEFKYCLPPVTINDEKGIKALWLSKPDGEKLNFSQISPKSLQEELLNVIKMDDTSQLIVSFENTTQGNNADFRKHTESLIILSKLARERGKIVHLCHLPGKLYENMCEYGKLGPTGLTIHAPIQDGLLRAHEIAYDVHPIVQNPTVPTKASLQVLAQVSGPQAKVISNEPRIKTVFDEPVEVDAEKQIFVQFANEDFLTINREAFKVFLEEFTQCEKACNKDYRKFLNDPAEFRSTFRWSINAPEIKHLILSFEGVAIEDTVIADFFKVLAELHRGRRDISSTLRICDLPENVINWLKTDEGKDVMKYIRVINENETPNIVSLRAKAASDIQKTYFYTYRAA